MSIISANETVYLLRSPENARQLMDAITRDKNADPGVTVTLEQLQEMAGGTE